MKLNQASLWNFYFIIWLIAETVIPHSVFSVMALALFCVKSILYIISRKKMIINVPIVVITYMLFIVTCALNMFLGKSISPSYSKAILGTLARNWLFLICLCIYVPYIGIEKFKAIFSKAIICASGFMLVYMIISTGSLQLRGGNAVNANVLAICNAIVIIIIAFDGRYFGLKKCASLFVLFFVLILAGTRKAILGLLIGSILVFLMRGRKQLVLKYLKIGALLILGYLIIMKTSWGYDLAGNRIETLFALFKSGETDGSSAMRMIYIQLGWRHFLESPLFGKGIDCFRTVSGSYGTYSHCNYIELLFGVGVLGTAIYYIPHISFLVNFLKKNVFHDKYNAVLAVAIVVVLLFFDVAWVSYYSRIALTFIVFSNYLIRSCQNDKHNKPFI